MVADVVPVNAVYGLLGYRLNAECLCQGLNDVLVGLLRYQETQGGSSTYVFSLPLTRQVYGDVVTDSVLVGGTWVSRVIVQAWQTFLPNSDIFPVTAGAQFQYTVPAATIGGDGWFGQVILLWFDKDHNQLPSIQIVPGPGRMTTATVTTAADGRFDVPKLPRNGLGSTPVVVEFAGDSTYRAATWSPLRRQR